MTFNSKITIIGGGIIGLLTAKEFVQAGCQVTVIDKSAAGQESSWAGGGILLPLYPWRQPPAISSLVLASIKNYADLAEELYSDTGIDPEWLDCGLLISKNPDIKLATDWCKRHDISYQTADSSFFKSLNTQTLSPLWLPSIAQIRNPRLLKALKTFLMNKNVQFIEQCEISNCILENQSIVSLNTCKGEFRVEQLVISAGAWSNRLIKQLVSVQSLPDISPVKGQMLLFDAKPDTLSHIILDGGHYLIPRRDGKILAGSSVEHSQFDKSTSDKAKNHLYHFAIELLPELNNYPVINHWAGLRPGTEQGIPYICKHSEIKNLSINAGHFRNGLAMAPASAKLLVDLVLERPVNIDPEPYKLKPVDSVKNANALA